MELICSKLGSALIQGDHAENLSNVELLTDLCISFGEWYDCNVLATFSATLWIQQLIKSELLCRLSQRLQTKKENDDGSQITEFEIVERNIAALFESLLAFHSNAIQNESLEKYILLKCLHETIRKTFEFEISNDG